MLNKKKVKWIILACVSVAIISGFLGKKHAIPAPLLNYMRNAPLARNIQWKISYLYDRLSNVIEGASDKDEHRPLNADFHDPSGLYVDSSGRIYFSERRNHVIRMIADGELTTIAGNRRSGYSGDGKRASYLRLRYPEGLAGDPSGNLLISDSKNHRIRRILEDGSIETIAGIGFPGFSGDGGNAKKAKLNAPMDVCTDPFGNIYIADWGNNRIRRITPGGIITTVAGIGKAEFSGDGAPAHKAGLNGPYGVYADLEGNIYISDSGNNRVRKISSGGIISTIAGTGKAGFYGDGGMATEAQLNSPQSVFVTPSKEIYINDEHNHRVRKILSSGIIITVVGNGKADYCGDGGPATDACLHDPEGIWVDDSMNLFITDGDNHRIRKVNRSGIITTIAGSGPIGKYKDREISRTVLK